MKKLISVLVMLSLLCASCWAVAEESAQPEMLAIYSCPDTQIITDDNQSKELVDTLIFLYQDYSYIQYVELEKRYEVYSKGTFELNFDWTESGWQDIMPHIITIHVEQIQADDLQMEAADLTYDVNLDRKMDYCLYPDNDQVDLKLVAVFMQMDKQKLVKTEGTEEYLPTIWLYYDDGTFKQYAVVDGENNILFSCGDYSVTSDSFANESMLTIHRTQKYQDGTGLTDYDSTHDYVLGELGFIRIYSR